MSRFSIVCGGGILLFALIALGRALVYNGPAERGQQEGASTQSVPAQRKGNSRDGAARTETTQPGADAVKMPSGRRAAAHLAVLPRAEQSTPVGSGLAGWKLYYDEIRHGDTVAFRPGVVWWTEDPAIVEIYVEEFSKTLPETVEYQEAFRKSQTELAEADPGRLFLEAAFDATESEIGVLGFQFDWLRDAGLHSTSAAELGGFLRAQANAHGRPIGQERGAYSIFSPFMVPLERHVHSVRSVRFQDLPGAEQTYLSEAYAQLLVDAAELRVRYLELEGAGLVTADNLGLPYADLETRLVDDVPELIELERSIKLLWEDFLTDLR